MSFTVDEILHDYANITYLSFRDKYGALWKPICEVFKPWDVRKLDPLRLALCREKLQELLDEHTRTNGK